MPNVYSQLLFSDPSTANNQVISDLVPTGFVWVVRTVSVLSPGQPFSVELGWQLLGAGNELVCGIGPGQGSGSSFYVFDVHHVVNTASNLVFSASTIGYSLNVSGYQLALP